MAITLGSTGLTFPDSTNQTTKFDPTLDHGKMLRIDSWQGNATWTKSAGVNSIHVLVTAGGGGGCGHAESGAAGGYAEKTIDVSSWAIGTTVAVTVGGGGDGRTYHQGCGAGGTSSFGPHVSASGGGGANARWGHSGGSGGLGSGGDINLWGGGGRAHGDQGQSRGGESVWGGAQPSGHHGGHYYSHYGEGHATPGSGGAGEWTTHSRGGNGRPGIVVVYNYA